MPESQSSYRQIMKATSTFGGVQVFQILTNLIKGKLVAILLGASGMGMTALFNTSLSMVTTISGLGLNTSAVRDISQSFESGDIDKLSRTVNIFRTWLKYCSVFGTILLCLVSPFLSRYTFGNYNYTLSFVLLSLMLVATLLTQGNTSILQGTRQLGYTAKSTLFGSIISLVLTIPFYYFFGLKGIVPALIVSSIGTFLVSRHFVKKTTITKQIVDRSIVRDTGKEMAKLGIAMVAAQLVGQVCVYFVNTYISKRGGLPDLGYFQAAMSMTSQAVTLIFAAMGADFYPRLVAVCNDKIKMSETVNQQGEILLLIAFPLLTCFMIFSPILIYLLLSPQFYIITNIIRLIAFGMLFKVISYSIGYISLAKGDRKIFLILEGGVGNFLQLTFNILGYTIAGLKGLAVSFVFTFIIYCIVVSFVAYNRYDFKISKSYIKILIPAVSLFSLTLLISFIPNQTLMYCIGSLFIFISFYFSFKELNKRIDLKSILEKFKR